MLLVPEINYLEVPKANKNWNSNRPPLPKKMKESALTSVTQDPEKMYSPYQQTLKSSYLDFTPNISTKHNNSHLTEQFNPRTNVKYSSSQDKIQK